MQTRTLRTLQNLCLNEFKMNLYSFNNTHYYDNSSGTFWSALLYVIEGQVELRSKTFTIQLNSGDFYFVPAKTRYEEYSIGDSPLKIYNIAFSFRESEGIHFDEKYDITKINTFPKEIIHSRLKQMFENFAKDEANQLLALSDFYSLFSEIFPILNEIKPSKLHPAVSSAMRYINDHLTDNYTIKDLAKHCNISESRLYHLFNSELNTTPISYKNNMKIKASFTLLTTTNLSIKEIADKMNFASVTHYRYAFRKTTNSTPNRYRKIFRLQHNNFKGH